MRKLAHPFNRDQSWYKDLNLADSDQDLDWETISSLPYRSTRETKLQSFSYKVIYRLTPCNKRLHTIGIRDSPTCSYCPEIDTVTHFFYRCVKVRTFWEALDDWCVQYLSLSISHLSEIEILLGLTKKEPGQKMVNWLLICAKFFIHRKRLFHGADMSLIEFLAEIRLKLSVERQACLREGKFRKFKCWSTLFSALG